MSNRKYGLTYRVRPGEYYCPGCQRTQRGGSYEHTKCRECIIEEHNMGKQDDIARAAREISRALAEAQKKGQSASIPAILERFKDGLGGDPGYAQALLDDFRRVRGQNLTEDERKEFEFKEQIIQKYHHMILTYSNERDKQVANQDLNLLSEDELRNSLEGLARELLEQDTDLRRQLIKQVIKEDPEVLKEIAEETIHIESTIVGDEPTPLDDEEATDDESA